jgi:hypothetical protein
VECILPAVTIFRKLVGRHFHVSSILHTPLFTRLFTATINVLAHRIYFGEDLLEDNVPVGTFFGNGAGIALEEAE